MTGLRSTVSCFDRIFDKASSDKYCLSIRLQSDGLFYSVYDLLNQKYIGFESVMLAGVSDVYDFIGNHETLKRRFQQTVCVLPASKFTIIPEALYLQERMEEYFLFVNQYNATEELDSTNLLSEDARIVYASEMAYFQIVKDYFPKAIILPGVACFARYILPRFKNNDKLCLFLNLYIDNFDLLLMGDGKLKFCNNFTYKSPEDLVYYTIFVFNQLKLNPEKVEVLVSGNIDSASQVLRLLRRYIKFVDVYSYEPDIQISYALNEIELHRYLDIFNPRLCEL